MRSPEQQDKDESYAALVDAKLEVMMADFNLVAAIVDDVIGSSAHCTNGCTEIANDLAEMVIDDDCYSAASDAEKFRQKLIRVVRERMRLDAETEVADECARSLDDKADYQHQQREDMEL